MKLPFPLLGLLCAWINVSHLTHADDSEPDSEFGPATELGPARKILEQAFTQFNNGQDALRVTYKKDLAKAISHADAATIYLLDFSMAQVDEAEDGRKSFPIAPYQKHTKILQEKQLEPHDLTTLKKATQLLLDTDQGLEGGAFCHFPIHGIRLYANGEVLFETSLCYKCSNYSIRFPGDFESASWNAITDQQIGNFLKKAMPIPQSELDRFEKLYGKKSKQGK